jgi:hypothetical protein
VKESEGERNYHPRKSGAIVFFRLSPSLSPNLTLHVCESVKALEV